VTSMTDTGPVVFGGVDTHRDTIHVAVVDALGRHLGDQEFATTRAGYRAAIRFLRRHGRIDTVGVEGTSSYGAGISAALRTAAITVAEVDRTDKTARYHHGKTDPIDAYAAARTTCAGRATTIPKTRDGNVEAIRALRVARTSAIKTRTQTINQIRALLVTAPTTLRETLPTTTAALIRACTDLPPLTTRADPTTATRHALRSLAHRYQHLTTEIRDLDKHLHTLLTHHAPHLLAIHGVGPDTAAQLLITAGDNPHRLHTEAAFAHLCGTAPIPASSGQTQHHRLNRGGDRQANRALWTITLTRLATDPRTKTYRDRRQAQGHTTKDTIRRLKRYIAREIYKALTIDKP